MTSSFVLYCIKHLLETSCRKKLPYHLRSLLFACLGFYICHLVCLSVSVIGWFAILHIVKVLVSD